jgi:hypothetical protein
VLAAERAETLPGRKTRQKERSSRLAEPFSLEDHRLRCQSFSAYRPIGRTMRRQTSVSTRLGTPPALLGELVGIAERIISPWLRLARRLGAASEQQLDRPHASPSRLRLEQLDQV